MHIIPLAKSKTIGNHFKYLTVTIPIILMPRVQKYFLTQFTPEIKMTAISKPRLRLKLRLKPKLRLKLQLKPKWRLKLKLNPMLNLRLRTMKT